MKTKQWILISISLMLALLCSCASLFEAPEKSQLEDEDFVFINQDGTEDVYINRNQYFFLRNGTSYFCDLAHDDNDITIETMFSTYRGVMYGSGFDAFLEAYEVQAGYGAWGLLVKDEEQDSENVYHVYENETLDDVAKMHEIIDSVTFSIGYYRDGDRWLRLTGEELVQISDGSFDPNKSDEIVMIAINIDSAGLVDGLCFYYATPQMLMLQL